MRTLHQPRIWRAPRSHFRITAHQHLLPALIRRAPHFSTSSTIHQLRPARSSHLDLEELDRGLFRASHKQLWVPPLAKSVFGGQVLGQALHAAQLSITRSSMLPVSLHCYFLQRGNATSDIIYQIQETADLRSFATRTVNALQNGTIIFKMQAQFAKSGESSRMRHAEAMPSDVLPPDACPTQAEMLDGLLTRAPHALHPLIEEMQVAPVEVRYASGEMPDPLDPDPPPLPSRQRLWVRIRDAIADSPGLDEACAAYLSDQPLLLTALRPHSVQFHKLGAAATLDHSMWFHGTFDCNDWLLFDMWSPHAGSGRALCFGHLYRPDTGELVVSCAQQGVLRLARPSVAISAATVGVRAWRLLNRVRGALGLGGGSG